MRVTSHTELLHDHHHHHNGACACGEHHSHAEVRLTQTLVGLVLMLNSYLVAWLFSDMQPVAAGSALLGAIVLGGPLVWMAITDLRAGSLNTNVLVAVAPAHRPTMQRWGLAPRWRSSCTNPLARWQSAR